MTTNNSQFNKLAVADSIHLYIFCREENRLQDIITVIVQEDRALLIDTAYPDQARLVKEDLETQGITVEIVVLSHYHADHAAGCGVFEGAAVYAGEHFEMGFNNCLVWESQYSFVRPQKIIREGDSLPFGDFRLAFFEAPGHSKDGIVTRVADGIFHVGDLIMMTVEGKASLPFIADGGDFGEHVGSLEMLKGLDPGVLLLPHGGIVKGREAILKMVDDRLHYLEKTAAAFGTLPLPACLSGDVSEYDYLEFHDTNLMRLG